MSTSNLNNRIDKEIKEQGIPSSLELEKYNKVTASAIEEGRKIAKNPNVKGYHTVDELKKALDSWNANEKTKHTGKNEAGVSFFCCR